jgi:integrase
VRTPLAFKAPGKPSAFHGEYPLARSPSSALLRPLDKRLTLTGSPSPHRVTQACRKDTLQVRRQYNLPMLPATPLIWNSWKRQQGKAYTAWGLQCCLWALLDACNIRTQSGRRPRVHDFRHSCAVNALIRWYRSGADVRTKLPFLAAYLGHVSIISTYRYLHFIEPLRALASARFSDSYGGLVVPLSVRERRKA